AEAPRAGTADDARWAVLEQKAYEAYTQVSVGVPETRKRTMDALEEARAHAERTGDRAGELAMTRLLVVGHEEASENRRALERLEQSLPLVRALGHQDLEAATVNEMAAELYYLGDLEEAYRRAERAAVAARDAGDPYTEALALQNKGSLAGMAARFDEAIEALEAAGAKMHAVGNRSGEAYLLISVGHNYVRKGELQKALDAFTRRPA